MHLPAVIERLVSACACNCPLHRWQLKMWHALASVTRYLTLKAHKTDTEEGRNRERYRLAAWNTLANAVSSAMGMLSLFVTIPLVLPYLGAERFGVWMSVSSLAAILSFMDLGIGNGLVNLVANAKISHNQPVRLKQIIFRGLWLLVSIGAGIGLAMTGLLQVLPITAVIKVSSVALATETRQTALTFAAIFAVSIPLFGLQRIFFGLQQSWLVHLTKIIGYMASPILAYILVKQQASIPALLSATYGVQTLSALFLLPFLLYKLRTDKTLPQKKSTTPIKQDLRALLGVGSVFFFLQIGGIVGWGSDALIAASVIGASAVAPLVIVQRLFQLVTVPLIIINGPLWAAYADARARNDTAFIRKTLRRSLKVTIVFATIASLTIVGISGWLTSTWIGTANNLPASLLVAFAVWTVMDATGNCFSMYLNGCNIVKAQLVVVILFCAVAIPLKFIFPLKFGIAGMIIATITAYIFCVVLPYATFLNKGVRAGLWDDFDRQASDAV